MIKDEPAEKIYVRSEDFRVGGYRYAPLKLIKSFQKQRIAGTKWQCKYHEAEMMDLDEIKPRLTLIPTTKLHRKREYTEWIENYYIRTTMFYQFSRILYEKSDGDSMYSAY